MRLDYQNQYGQLTLVLVGDVRPVKDIRGVDVAIEHKFDIDVAEQIALITENGDIQLAPTQDDDGRWRCYVIAHDTPSRGAVARVESINYIGGDPAKEIEKFRILFGQ